MGCGVDFDCGRAAVGWAAAGGAAGRDDCCAFGLGTSTTSSLFARLRDLASWAGSGFCAVGRVGGRARLAGVDVDVDVGCSGGIWTCAFCGGGGGTF